MVNPELPKFFRIWDRLDGWLAAFESALIVIALAGMTIMTLGQVILRNFFSTGVLWFDPTVRHLLLLVGFVGASLATRYHRHINVDALSKFFHGKGRHALNVFIALVAAAICIVLLKGAIRFVGYTFESGDRLHGHFPAWIAQAVIPYGFLVMAIRFFKTALEGMAFWRKGLPPEERAP